MGLVYNKNLRYYEQLLKQVLAYFEVLECLENAFELVEHQESLILVHVGFHVICDRLKGNHQRFFNPNVKVRVINLEFASPVRKSHLSIIAWLLTRPLTRNRKLFLANYKPKTADKSVNGVVDIFVK